MSCGIFERYNICVVKKKKCIYWIGSKLLLFTRKVMLYPLTSDKYKDGFTNNNNKPIFNL